MFKALHIGILIFLTFPFFAQQTVGLFEYSDETALGYTLFSTTSDKIYLIDNCGKTINQWTAQSRGYGPAYLLPDGKIIKSSRAENNQFNGGGAAGLLEMFDWNGNLIWSIEYNSTTFTTHHDICPLPNGNILLITWDVKTEEQIMEKGRTSIPNGGLWTERIIEIEPIGFDQYEIVWEWDIFDHTIQNVDASLPNYGQLVDHPNRIDINAGSLAGNDWLHFNSIDYNEALDQILLSSRSTSEIYIIDHSTTVEEAKSSTGGNSNLGGDLLFRWGNPAVYEGGNENDQQLFFQHNARWIKPGNPGEGNITVFNNNKGISVNQSYSTIEEIMPSFNGISYGIQDLRFLPMLPEWTYGDIPSQRFYSTRISSAQRLPNGNTIINMGNAGRFFEINETDEIVWEYICPVGIGGPINQEESIPNNEVFIINKYAFDHPFFEGKDLTPGDPIELNPYDYECQISSGIKTETISSTLTVQNPVTNQLRISTDNNQPYLMKLFTANGRQIMEFDLTGNKNISVAHLSNGIYFLQLNADMHKLIIH